MTFNLFGYEITILVRKKRIDMKSNREVIWDAIAYMKYKTSEPDSSPLVDLTTDFWVSFTLEQRQFYRALLLKNGLIHLNETNFWEFKLTADALTNGREDYTEKGVLKKDKELWRQVKIGIAVAIVSVVLGAILSPIQQLFQKQPPNKIHTKILILPKIQIVHDTIYLKK